MAKSTREAVDKMKAAAMTQPPSNVGLQLDFVPPDKKMITLAIVAGPFTAAWVTLDRNGLDELIRSAQLLRSEMDQ